MERELTAGSMWLHFKGEHVATVIAVAKHTETNEMLVVYDCYNNTDRTSIIVARPMDMFLSEVDHEKYPDAKQKYRFERVS